MTSLGLICPHPIKSSDYDPAKETLINLPLNIQRQKIKWPRIVFLTISTAQKSFYHYSIEMSEKSIWTWWSCALQWYEQTDQSRVSLMWLDVVLTSNKPPCPPRPVCDVRSPEFNSVHNTVSICTRRAAVMWARTLSKWEKVSLLQSTTLSSLSFSFFIVFASIK